MIARCSRYGLLGALLMAGLAGCPQSDDIGTTLPVSGKVTIDSKPLANGTVSYMPIEAKGNKTKAAVSGIVTNGEYTLKSGSATTNKNGAPPGWYKVIITTTAMTMAPAPKEGATADPKKLGAPTGTPIAEKYTSASTTPLEVEVKSGNNAAYNLDAKSK